MKLEKEIKQEKFRNEYQKLVLNLMYTANWLSNSISKILKEFNITEEQYNILRILRGQNGKIISALDIQNRMLKKMSNTSRLVEKLRFKGLVSRCESNKDRRLVDVKITGEGLKLLLRIDPCLEEFENFLSKINEKEASELNSYLDRLRD